MIETEIANCRSKLLRFAISLSHNIDAAEDLVQEAMLRAIANKEKYTEGTNLDAWLFTILKNHYFSSKRKVKREVPDIDDVFSSAVKISEDQHWVLEYAEFMKRVEMLPSKMKEAFIAVVLNGESYEDVAETCDVDIGTIKSRVNRAKEVLDLSESKGAAIKVRALFNKNKSASEISNLTGIDLIEVIKMMSRMKR